MMDRVIPFDSESIEVRAHLFHDDAEETYIHNHTHAFISVCLSGSYIHILYAIKQNAHDGQYYVTRRQRGGIYCEKTACIGNIENILCQLAAGQSLLMSALANYSVERV
jgi:hypothetical protein